MAILSEFALHAINALTPDFPQHVTLLDAMADEDRHFDWEYREGQKLSLEWQPALDVCNRHVLDVGSGSGAKALLYSQMGAATVTGLDISQDLVNRAKQRLTAVHATDPASQRVQIILGDATRMPFPNGAFDVIVSINAMEHIDPPQVALGECSRVLRPGGRAYLRFPPYWSAWGPHLERWIRFPWPHLLFAEPTLIAAANRIEAQVRMNERLTEFVRLDLRGASRLTHVNHLTMAQFERYLAGLPFNVIGLQMIPIGYRFLPHLAARLGPLGALPRLIEALLYASAYTPWGRETLATKAVVVLERL